MINPVINSFKNAINKNRLSHLYILSGKTGTGKLNLSFEISNLILEKYDKRDNLLELIKTNNHSQIFLVKPDGNVIKKQQIIDLQDEFSKTSLLDAPRIYIIKDIDLISSSAANSLLKFMEEPDNESVYGILISSNISNVLPTIISRAQVMRVNSDINENHLYDYLLGEDTESFFAKHISFLTNNKEEALTLKEDSSIKIISNFILSFIENYSDNKYNALTYVSDELSKILYDRKYYQIFLELMLVNLVDLLKYLLKEEIEFSSLNEVYKNNYQDFDSKIIIKMIKLIQEELKKLTTYINIGLSFDVLLINLKKLG